MGCSSSSALPPEILADPGDTEECVFTITSTGMFNSRDCYAYKGDSTDKKDRWFLLKKIKEKKKEARAFEGERTVDLENFVREDGSKKGAVLWTAAFDSKPSFEVNGAQGAPPPWAATYVGVQVPEGHAGVLDVTMPSSATVRVAVPAGTAPGQVIQVADPGLASPALEYWRRLDGKWGPSPRSGEKISGGIEIDPNQAISDASRQRQMDKFTLRTRARIAPGTRGRTFGEGFELQVYARGTSVCKWHWSEGGHSDQGEQSRAGWKSERKSFVDALHFNLVQAQTGQSVATWTAAGDDLVKGGQYADVAQENAVFKLATNKGGWLGKTIRLETRPHWDPCLALVVAHLCSKEYCPEEIHEDFCKFFKYPTNPPGGGGFHGFGRGNFGQMADMMGMSGAM